MTAKLMLPGKSTQVGLQLPKNLSADDWIECGKLLTKMESGVLWWRGDWWNFGIERKYGEGQALAAKAGVDYGLIRDYGAVARAYELSVRTDNLSWAHYRRAMALPENQRLKWLERAMREKWSANQLAAQIRFQAARDRTAHMELAALAGSNFSVLLADPPWQYESPPMGGSNRSIEGHYPTLGIEEICAMAVSDIAAENAVLLMWATSPKLMECFAVMAAWGFLYRTSMVWVKDRVGMGDYVRNQHELVLIGKRGALPPPAPEDRPASVFSAPRLEHLAKPPIFHDIIDDMYPGLRKVELFGREPEERPLWTHWGNQATPVRQVEAEQTYSVAENETRPVTSRAGPNPFNGRPRPATDADRA